MYKTLLRQFNGKPMYLVVDQNGHDSTGNLYPKKRAEKLCKYLNERGPEFADRLCQDLFNGFVSINFKNLYSC